MITTSDERNAAWWREAPLPGGQGDAETARLDAEAVALGDLPPWAVAVRGAMPRWGMEMCAHRWLDGLDELMHMLTEQAYWPITAGHCGDVPGRVRAQALQRALAVERWSHQLCPLDPEMATLADRLGTPTPEKIEAAACFCALVEAAFGADRGVDIWPAAEARWSPVAEHNAVLACLLGGDGLWGAVKNPCGFGTIARLDAFIGLLGGEPGDGEHTSGTCNQGLRRVFTADRERYAVTRGYLWGWWAALSGYDRGWLRANKPECLGAAIYAWQRACLAKVDAPLGHWLAGSLFKTTHLWAERCLRLVGNRPKPAWADDLPTLPM